MHVTSDALPADDMSVFSFEIDGMMEPFSIP